MPKSFSFFCIYHYCASLFVIQIDFLLYFRQTKVDPARDVIYVNGNRLPKKLPPKVYLALNKPKGFVILTCVFNVLLQIIYLLYNSYLSFTFQLHMLVGGERDQISSVAV